MPISKRLRYEVLRRDNFTCRYCHTDDKPLTVDHVMPTALGGTDDPTNLVACCRDCNAGKTSVQPGADTVADVADDAIRWARAIQHAAQLALLDKEQRDQWNTAVKDVWKRWDAELEWLPPDFGSATERWRISGLPLEIVAESIEIAAKSTHVSHVNVWRYAYGIVNRRLEQLHKDARAALTEDPTDA